MYHVILAGGSGSRFWPKSREDTPKQLLKILGEETMIRLTYNRLREIANSDKIFVVASAKLSKLIHNPSKNNQSKVVPKNQPLQ